MNVYVVLSFCNGDYWIEAIYKTLESAKLKKERLDKENENRPLKNYYLGETWIEKHKIKNEIRKEKEK